MKCNRDCFNCIYEDCIQDDVSDEERAFINSQDRSLRNQRAKSPGPVTSYYSRNTEYCKRRSLKYYQEHREECLDRFKNYYQRNKERIIAQKREWRHMKKQREVV